VLEDVDTLRIEKMSCVMYGESNIDLALNVTDRYWEVFEVESAVISSLPGPDLANDA
jgi:hypothetical protein